jgi:hypothetical protein
MDKVPMELTEEGFGAALAVAYREHASWFDKLHRYSTTAERTFFKATRELAMIRKAGPQQDIGYVSQDAKHEETTEQTAQPIREIGCVSQPAQPSREPGVLSSFISAEKLETMSEAEAFDLLDKLTAPPVTSIPKHKAGY